MNTYEKRGRGAPAAELPACNITRRGPWGDLDRQLGQIVVADLYVLEWRLGLVVFHEIMLDSGFARLGKDPLPVDFALADVRHVAGLFGASRCAAIVAAAGTL